MWNSLSNISFYENLLEQKRKENNKITRDEVDLSQLCRTCLRDAPDTNNLLKDFEIGAMNINLDGKLLKMIDMLRESTGIEINDYDPLPHQICNNCIQNVSGAYFFRLQSVKAEATLNKLVEALDNETEESLRIEPADESFLDGIGVKNEEVFLDSDDKCDLMEIEFDNEQYKETNETSTEKDDLVIEFQENSGFQEYEIEVLEKTDDDSSSATEMSENKLIRKGKGTSCPECEDIFDYKKDLEEHIRTVHPKIKAYECDICHARFSKIQTMRRHLKIHQADQKNKLCTFCGKAFTRTDDLKRHIRTHTNERPYACTICPKSYKQTSELKEHMLSHSKEKTYTCQICGKGLQTRNGHYIHMKAHLGVKNHKCQMCNKEFVTSGELHSHIRHIHDKNRPYLCQFKNCDRTFVTKLSLQIHERSHTGERPFSCKVCRKRLATSSSLSEHMKKLHNVEKQQICKYCNESFPNLRCLKMHIRKHEDEGISMFSCLICHQTFDTIEELKADAERHMLDGNTALEKLKSEEHLAEDDIVNNMEDDVIEEQYLSYELEESPKDS